MEAVDGLLHGLSVAVQPKYLLWALAGVTVGTLVGVLPGIGPAQAIALLLPLTFTVEPSAAFIMFGGIYYGCMFGGSTTSILLRTPGEAGSIFTAIEGNKMARSGRAGAALATSAIGSFIAGAFATLALGIAAPYVVSLALHLGPADYFTLILVALIVVGVLLGESVARGIASLGLGLAFGLIGYDAQSGMKRFDFGMPQLASGLGDTVIVVGLFAVGGTLYYAAYRRAQEPAVMSRGRVWLTREEWRRSWPAWLRGTAIGWPLGAVPVGGAELPTFLSYSYELRKRRRKRKKHPVPLKDGRDPDDDGIIEAVAGPEAANNANAAGVLMPLLTLGLPTSATAAVLLIAFQQYGLRPGPLLLDSQPELVWGLIAALFIGNAMLLVLNLPLVGLWAKVLKLPGPYLNAAIATFAMLGAYTTVSSTFQVYTMLVIGVVGFALSRFGYPVAPLIIAAILGPIAEVELRRTLEISAGDPSPLFLRPLPAVAYSVVIVLFVVSRVMRYRRRLADRTSAQHGDAATGTGAAEPEPSPESGPTSQQPVVPPVQTESNRR